MVADTIFTQSPDGFMDEVDESWSLEVCNVDIIVEIVLFIKNTDYLT